MSCQACGRDALPGGVRCFHCGSPFPAAASFDLGSVAGPQRAASPTPRATSDGSTRRIPGLVGLILLLVLKGKSLLTLLKLGPLLTTLGTMYLWVQLEANRSGWGLAAGLGLCILVHEMGHVLVNRLHGLRCSAPMFIPFLGALITVKDFPRDPTVEAHSGAGGPAAGLLATVGCWILAVGTGNPFFLGLAGLNCAINFFNLTPVLFLDGARIGSALAPLNWDVLIVGLLLVVLKSPLDALWPLVILMFLIRLSRPAHGRHDLADPAGRWWITLLYFGLAVSLAGGMAATRPHLETVLEARRATRAATGPAAPPTNSPAPPAPVTATPEPDPDVQGEEVGTSMGGVEVTAIVGLLYLATWVVWPFTAWLLARVGGKAVRWGAWGMALAFVFGSVACPIGVALAGGGLLATRGELLSLVYASIAAWAAGLGYAVFQASRRPDPGMRPPGALFLWQALGWIALSGLITAYAFNSWVVLALVLGCSLLFMAVCRSGWPLLVAGFWERVGNATRANEWRRRAIQAGPDGGTAAEVWEAIARSELVLGRGERALEAVDQMLAAGGPSHPESRAGIGEQALRAEALLHLGAQAAALSTCEELLRGPDPDRKRALRLRAARPLLARLAAQRGWFEEARSQAEALLADVAGDARPEARQVAGQGRRLRAAALLGEGRLAEAARDLEAAAQWSLAPAADVELGTLRAWLALARGDATAAEEEAAVLLKRAPGAVPVQFVRAQAWRALGRGEEADRLLHTLAREFPRDYWGIRAREALAAE